MDNQEINYDIYQPFGPSILKVKMPQPYVNLLNTEADTILYDENLSKKYDWSHNLAGNVKKEIAIDPSKIKGFPEFLVTMSDQYLTKVLPEWTTDAKVSFRVWVVSQYAGDFNPAHHHSGDFSGVIYLKLPPKMHDEIVEDSKDHYPASGLIEFMFGENQEFRSDNLKFKPEVGKLLVFPSWLKHFVYPFTCEGERRSMSFNAHMYVPE